MWSHDPGNLLRIEVAAMPVKSEDILKLRDVILLYRLEVYPITDYARQNLKSSLNGIPNVWRNECKLRTTASPRSISWKLIQSGVISEPECDRHLGAFWNFYPSDIHSLDMYISVCYKIQFFIVGSILWYHCSWHNFNLKIDLSFVYLIKWLWIYAVIIYV